MARHDLEFAQQFVESQLLAAARELELHAPEAAAAFMRAIPLAQAQRLLAHMLPAFAARIVQSIPAESTAAMLSGSSSNQIVAILRQVSPQLRNDLLDLLPDNLASRCRRLLYHAEDTVGAWMTVDIVMLPGNITAADALHRVAAGDDIGDANTLPLVDEDQKLVGFVGVGDLLRAKSETLVALLRRDIETVALPSKMSLRAARSHPGWQAYDNLIVLNQGGQPEGLLRHVALLNALSISRQVTPVVSYKGVLNDVGHAYLDTLAGLFKLVNSDQETERRAAIARGEPR